MGCCGGGGGAGDEDEKAKKEANKRIEKQLQKDKQLYRATHRLLLLGRFPLLYMYIDEPTCLPEYNLKYPLLCLD